MPNRLERQAKPGNRPSQIVEADGVARLDGVELMCGTARFAPETHTNRLPNPMGDPSLKLTRNVDISGDLSGGWTLPSDG